NGELYQTAELYTDAEISVNGTNTVVIHDGEVYMESADCPDQLCVKQGKIHDAGRDIVCLPNRVVVSVSKESTVDAISE
ncbi:MAG TPA: NusG domain II-containing protein, partial [Candidatus Avimonoglobus intestinipullorum]|nr:NusG domain II-containing protein [Candidatus Avimonoglobus intestinipullorum]